MELKEIEDSLFDEFVYNSSKSHFMQTSAWGEVNRNRNYIPHKLGLFDNESLKGVALLLEKKILYYSSFYCPRGFIVDYDNRELVKEMISQLKKYVHSHRGLYFKMDPDIIIRKLDKDGNVVETFDNNLELIDFLKENGGTHKGFTTNFIDTASPRFTFRVDVDKSEDELANSFHNTTKKIIDKHNPYHIDIKKGTAEDLDDFYLTMKETSQRKKMYIEPFSYFENFYKTLNRYDMSDIFVASIKTSKLKEAFEERRLSIEKEIEDTIKRPDGKKKESHLKDLEQKKNRFEKELLEVNKITKDKIILSSIITAKFKDKVWTIHGGSSDELIFLNGNYELYYSILLDSMHSGYKLVDFYGSEGVVDPKSPIYGIFLFKLRFGGDFDEFSGEFDFIVRPFMNKIISFLLNIRRKIRYKRSIKNGN